MVRVILLISTGLLLACAGGQDMQIKPAVLEHKSPYDMHRSLAYTLIRTDQAERAVPHIKRMLSSKPESPEAHAMMGRVMLEMRLLKQAKAELDKAIELDDKYSPAHSLKGVLLDILEQHTQAERSHRQAIKLAAKVAAYYNNLGFNLYLQGKYRQSIKAYEKALREDPAIQRVHNNLGFVRAKQGQLDQAYRHFKIGGNKAQADNNMGYVYEQRGDLQQALKYYAQATQSDSSLRKAKENFERVSKKLGKPLPAVLQFPNNPKAKEQPEP